MNPKDGDKSERDRRLDEAVTAYLKDIELGRPPSHNEWLARYPDLAVELAAFFAAQDQVDHLAAPLRVQAPKGPPKTDAGPDAATIAPTEAAPADPQLGTTVRYFGDYELLDEIARGGMGVVYKAKQISLNRIVALKMILAGQFASAVEVQRFQTEAEAAANLDHPNIVPIYEVGEHEGRHYFSMKLIAQGSGARSHGSGIRPTPGRPPGGDGRARGPLRPSARHHPSRFETGQYPGG